LASLTIDRMSKDYGDVRAVDALEIHVEDGAFLTLLGPSGCGKSTALACIAGLESLTRGSILFGERDVTDLEPHERNVAMVFQDYALYPHMNVAENIAFGLKQQKIDAATIKRQVDAAAEMLGLGELLHRRPAELSGGQRQRVAVGRAAVRNPAVLLMDEPLSNLDAGLRLKTRTEIKRLQRELGMTTVFVTHDQEEAMVLSDQMAVMRDGVLQQMGPPMAVYREPANLFVASFIGSPAMNFLDVELGVADGMLAGRFAGHGFTLPLDVVKESSLARLAKGRPALMGIRPSDLLLGGGSDQQVNGRNFLVEPVGPITYLDVDVAGRVVKAACDPDAAPPVGELVTLGFASNRVRLFDQETEERL
jgi:ABC-type sugar transport system ATPase subunit